MPADPPDHDAPIVRLRWATVATVNGSRPGAVELTVDVDGRPEDALAYPPLVGSIEAGDRVLLNTTAVHLGLGTGGLHLVVAVDAARSTEVSHDGHVMKARYTPAQAVVRTVEETHRDVLESARGLDGMPVVCAPLHSMLAPAAAGAKASAAARVAYVMTDRAALPGAFSRLVPRLREAGLLDGVVTCGQAFGGGDLEAVTVWTGLLAARHVLGADVAIVADGPGTLGTDTTWGVTALSSGEALNAVDALRGRPVAALRISFADERDRHRIVSHHSLTILERVATVRANVAVPALDDARRAAVWDALRDRTLEDRHQLVEVDGRPALEALDAAGVEVTSMGRSVDDDPAFFLAAGAAGVLAGRMAAGSRRYGADAG